MPVHLPHPHGGRFENISYWQGLGQGAVWARDHSRGWCDGFWTSLLFQFQQWRQVWCPNFPPAPAPHLPAGFTHWCSLPTQQKVLPNWLWTSKKGEEGEAGEPERGRASLWTVESPPWPGHLMGPVTTGRNSTPSSCPWFGGWGRSPTLVRTEYQRSLPPGSWQVPGDVMLLWQKVRREGSQGLPGGQEGKVREEGALRWGRGTNKEGPRGLLSPVKKWQEAAVSCRHQSTPPTHPLSPRCKC